MMTYYMEALGDYRYCEACYADGCEVYAAVVPVKRILTPCLWLNKICPMFRTVAGWFRHMHPV